VPRARTGPAETTGEETAATITIAATTTIGGKTTTGGTVETTKTTRAAGPARVQEAASWVIGSLPGETARVAVVVVEAGPVPLVLTRAAAAGVRSLQR